PLALIQHPLGSSPRVSITLVFSPHSPPRSKFQITQHFTARLATKPALRRAFPPCSPSQPFRFACDPLYKLVIPLLQHELAASDVLLVPSVISSSEPRGAKKMNRTGPLPLQCCIFQRRNLERRVKKFWIKMESSIKWYWRRILCKYIDVASHIMNNMTEL